MISQKRETTLIWKKICVSIGQKVILNNCSGYCKPGSMVAIMGSSGAGKTTLLSVICGQRDSKLNIQGQITANQEQYSFKDFFRFASFVRQNDILHEALTVRQTLYFTSKLKLKDEDLAVERTNQLIKMFELQKCENAKAGGTFFKGISGGEKKRLCIALQMINEPSVLVLDEPTSGLDSDKAIKVLKVLKKLSEKKKTILFTIHQPSYLIYNSLDKLLLLKKGEMIYEGKASSVLGYMNGLGVQVNKKYNICDAFMLEISEYKARTKNYQTPFNSEAFKKQILPQLKKEIEDMESKPVSQFKLQQENEYSNICGSFKTLLKRQIALFYKNPLKMGRVIFTIILQFFMIGITFRGIISDNRPSPSEVYPIELILLAYFFQAQLLCFINIASILLSRIYTTALVLPAERQVFLKQSMSKVYPTWSYFLAKIMIQLPSLCLGSLIYTVGAYWLMGFTNQIQKFGLFIAIMIILAVAGHSIGMFCGILFQDASKVTVLIPMIMIPLMLFAGIFNNLNDIPKWISWIQYLTPLKYGTHYLMLNQYGDQTYQVAGQNPFQYKQYFGIDFTLQQNFLAILGISIFFYLFAFILLLRSSSKIII